MYFFAFGHSDGESESAGAISGAGSDILTIGYSWQFQVQGRELERNPSLFPHGDHEPTGHGKAAKWVTGPNAADGGCARILVHWLRGLWRRRRRRGLKCFERSSSITRWLVHVIRDCERRKRNSNALSTSERGAVGETRSRMSALPNVLLRIVLDSICASRPSLASIARRCGSNVYLAKLREVKSCRDALTVRCVYFYC